MEPGACPFQDTLELLSRRHALTIVWFLSQRGTARFNEIKEALGVNQMTLSQRLSELEASGVVSRTAHNEIPPRVDYALTGPGRDLVPLLDAMDHWAARHGQLVPPRA